MPYSYYYWGFDPTYILVLIGAVICLVASARVKSTYNKYASYRSMSGMTGAQAAERILHSAGIYDVSVQHVSGNLTDHYNPSNKTLNLSDSVYGSTSVAAVGVAAHECGHAIQHQQGYVPLTLRSAIVPGGKYRFYAGVAFNFNRIIFYQQYRDIFNRPWNSLFFVRCSVSACDASGGVQCIAPRAAHFRRAGNLKRQ